MSIINKTKAMDCCFCTKHLFMKNIFLICLMAVASTHAFAQIQITLITSKIKADSVVITNQGQLFRAQAPGGNTVTLRLDTPREMDIYNIHIFRNTEKIHAQVWLNKGNITIKAHEEKIVKTI